MNLPVLWRMLIHSLTIDYKIVSDSVLHCLVEFIGAERIQRSRRSGRLGWGVTMVSL